MIIGQNERRTDIEIKCIHNKKIVVSIELNGQYWDDGAHLKLEGCELCTKEIEKKEESVINIAKEDISVYATKYKECRMCGTEADCTYISQIDGLCNACRSNEEYYEHEHRVSGD